MVDRCEIWLPNGEITHLSGKSLAKTLYDAPLTITLSGELGAGKTTFLQGFMAGLGINEAVTSPTYALEQRYETTVGTVSHIDLYRLDPSAAVEFMTQLDDDAVLRCVEWAERADLHGDIHIELREDREKAGRHLTIAFADMPLPTAQDIVTWRDEVSLPENIIKHCDAVADLAASLATELQQTGIIIRPLALKRAAEVHDLLRFVDFTPGAGPKQAEDPAWQQYKKQYDGLRHEQACAEFLRDRGFRALANIVEVHGLQLPAPQRSTIEQKLLFYADKRVMQDTVVSLDERFADFRNRYSDGKHTEEGSIWYQEARTLEQELFPSGTPL